MSVLAVKKPYFLAPHWDVWLTGGISLLTGSVFLLFVDKSSPTSTVRFTAAGLAYFINNPHFIFSYQILWNEYRGRTLKDPHFFMIGILFPIVFLSLGVYAIHYSKADILGYFVSLMYFTVGWHYVRQTYGIVAIYSRLYDYALTKMEIFVLQTGLYLLWAFSWIGANLGTDYSRQSWGVHYTSAQLPGWLFETSLYIMWIGLAATVYMTYRKYLREGKLPPPAVWVPFATMYVWYIPIFKHPAYAVVIPALHSLQQLVFSLALKRNGALQIAKDLPKAQRPQAMVKNFGYSILIACLFGALGFEFLPRFFDSQITYNKALVGVTAYMALAHTFINIHHYFIESLIWKGRNPELKTLFAHLH